MKAIYESLPPLAAKDLVACEVVRGKDFGCQWHFHPEIELILIQSGGTERWIGDNISPLRDGDLFLIGSNLPHDFRNERTRGARFRPVHAVVLQFHPEFLGGTWLQRADMEIVHQLCQRAGHGLQVTGRTAEKVAEGVRRAPRIRGLDRLIVTLQLLQILSRSRDLRPLASPGFSPEVQIADGEKMAEITNFIQKHLPEPMYLDDVARHVGMGSASFSRYFRQRTGKTFPAYLNEMRVARVCRLLAETDGTVTEIALACGFDSMANFEKQFHALKGCSPKSYRRRALGLSFANNNRPG
jgi:AraC-like DNA-binding protein